MKHSFICHCYIPYKNILFVGLVSEIVVDFEMLMLKFQERYERLIIKHIYRNINRV